MLTFYVNRAGKKLPARDRDDADAREAGAAQAVRPRVSGRRAHARPIRRSVTNPGRELSFAVRALAQAAARRPTSTCRRSSGTTRSPAARRPPDMRDSDRTAAGSPRRRASAPPRSPVRSSARSASGSRIPGRRRRRRLRRGWPAPGAPQLARLCPVVSAASCPGRCLPCRRNRRTPAPGRPRCRRPTPPPIPSQPQPPHRHSLFPLSASLPPSASQRA